MIETDILLLATMVSILGLFTTVFAATYLYDRKQKFAGWLAISYICGLAAFLVDINRFEYSLSYLMLRPNCCSGDIA